jgi:hypothetical protein
MFSMTRLGQMGRLGNQLFQYAFLRTLARRRGTQFFCPHWIGDEIFTLKDTVERAPKADCNNIFKDHHLGYDPQALVAPDGTDYEGNFESWRYFSAEDQDVRRWYGFRPEMTRRVREKYAGLPLSEMTCFHLRFGDYRRFPAKLVFFNPSADYYHRAVATLSPRRIAVFSDDLPAAQNLLAGLPVELVLIEGNEAWEDLYLMTQCGAHVVSASTFSWWGAWLATAPGKRVIRPAEGRFRPGSWPDNPDFYPPEWATLPALSNSIREQYWFLKMQDRLLKAASLPGRAIRRTGRGIRKLTGR